MHNLSRHSQNELLRFIANQFDHFIALSTQNTPQKTLKNETKVMLEFIRDLLTHYEFDLDLREKLMDSADLVLAYSQTLIEQDQPVRSTAARAA